MRSIVWFRGKDLRVHDHPALSRAARESSELLPVFVLDPGYFGGAGRGRADAAPHRLQFLLESLAELAANLAALGSRLRVVHGPASRALPAIAAQLRVDRIYAIGACEPGGRERDRRLAERLPLTLCGHETLLAPGSLRNAAGEPFRVYTPFARAALAALGEAGDLGVLPGPRTLPPPPRLALRGTRSADARAAAIPSLSQLGLTHNPQLLTGGERAALWRLRRFVQRHARAYADARDRLDRAGTSRVSQDLHFGTLSIRQVLAGVRDALEADTPEAYQRYLSELLWREFAHHTLYDRPELLREPFRAEFRGFPYRRDERGWRAWAEGRTGYPLVDAAAQQLLREGFVHNRARMISASFLTKHLAISYRRGEAHYLQWLTDGDAAQNNMGWQWSAGCGCDAQPYFRIFNPVVQGERFDPDGSYVRRYLPQLARLPQRFIHAPWRAPATVLREAGVALGRDYPRPCVDHAEARQRFLLLASEHLAAKRAGSRRRHSLAHAKPAARSGKRRKRSV